VLLEELNLKYEIKTYKRNKDGLAPPELKNFHPLGKSTSMEIEFPGQAPLVLAESGAMFEYLCAHFGKHLIPASKVASGEVSAETEAFRRNQYFMNYAEGSLMSLLATAAVMSSKLHRKLKSVVSTSNLKASLTPSDIKNAPVPFFIKLITRVITSRID
jgi:glutathione S-transferase